MKMNRREAIAGMGATAAATYLAGNLTAQAAEHNTALNAVYDYVEKNYDVHLAKIQEFVRQKSISSQDIGMRDCANLLAGYVRELGQKQNSRKPTVFRLYSESTMSEHRERC